MNAKLLTRLSIVLAVAIPAIASTAFSDEKASPANSAHTVEQVVARQKHRSPEPSYYAARRSALRQLSDVVEPNTPSFDPSRSVSVGQIHPIAESLIVDSDPRYQSWLLEQVPVTADVIDDQIIHVRSIGGNVVRDPAVFDEVSVLLTGVGKAFCSGVLISRNVVLTAAHCLCHAPSFVVFGPDASSTDDVHVEQIDLLRTWKPDGVHCGSSDQQLASRRGRDYAAADKGFAHDLPKSQNGLYVTALLSETYGQGEPVRSFLDRVAVSADRGLMIQGVHHRQYPQMYSSPALWTYVSFNPSVFAVSSLLRDLEILEQLSPSVACSVAQAHHDKLVPAKVVPDDPAKKREILERLREISRGCLNLGTADPGAAAAGFLAVPPLLARLNVATAAAQFGSTESLSAGSIVLPKEHVIAAPPKSVAFLPSRLSGGASLQASGERADNFSFLSLRNGSLVTGSSIGASRVVSAGDQVKIKFGAGEVMEFDVNAIRSLAKRLRPAKPGYPALGIVLSPTIQGPGAVIEKRGLGLSRVTHVLALLSRELYQ